MSKFIIIFLFGLCLHISAFGAEIEFKFKNFLTSQEGELRFQIEDQNQTKIARLSVHSHSELLSKYWDSSPAKIYKKVLLSFENSKTTKEFVEKLRFQSGVSKHRFIVEETSDTSLTLQDFAVQESQPEAREILGSFATDLWRILTDIPENINLFSCSVAEVQNNKLVPSEMNFDVAQVAFERWAKLTRSDWAKIVAEAQYPEDVSALIVEKILCRRNALIKILKIQSQFPEIRPRLDLNIGDVRLGQVTRNYYEGYSQKFADDEGSSYLPGDWARRYMIQGYSDAMNSIIKSAEIAYKGITGGSSPGAIFGFPAFPTLNKEIRGALIDLPMGAWVAPSGRTQLKAYRSLYTGNYFQDASELKMVDQLSVEVGGGAAISPGNWGEIDPAVQAHLIYRRDYIHLRPVHDTYEVLRTTPGRIWIPGFMKYLDRMASQDLSQTQPDFDNFLGEFRENETIVITDTVGHSVEGTLNVPIWHLALPYIPGSPFQAVIAASGGTRAVVIKKTFITRKGNHLRISFIKMNFNTKSLIVELNLFVNILRFGGKTGNGKAVVKSFELPLDSTDFNVRREAGLALKSVLRTNRADFIEDSFSPSRAEHSYQGKLNRENIFGYKHDEIEEATRSKFMPIGQPAKDVLAFDRIWLEGGTFRTTRTQTEKLSEDPNAQWSELITEQVNRWFGWKISIKGLLGIFNSLEAPGVSIEKTDLLKAAAFQLFDIRRILRINESGVQTLKDNILFPKQNGRATEKSALDALIEIYGKWDYDRECGQSPKIGSSYFGTDAVYDCVPYVIKELLDLRRASTPTIEDRLKWSSRFINRLERFMGPEKMIPYLSPDQFSYFAKVVGYKSSEEAQWITRESTELGNRSHLGETYQSKSYEELARFFAEEFSK